jgi:hypothetical protein
MSSISRGLLLLLVVSIMAGCQTTSLERELAYNQDKLRVTEEQRDQLEFQLATAEREQSSAISELVSVQQKMANISAKNAALVAENQSLMARPIPASAIIDEVDLGGFDGIDGLKAASDGGTVTLTLVIYRPPLGWYLTVPVIDANNFDNVPAGTAVTSAAVKGISSFSSQTLLTECKGLTTLAI